MLAQAGRLPESLAFFEERSDFDTAGLPLGGLHAEAADAMLDLRLLPEARVAADRALREFIESDVPLMRAEAQLRLPAWPCSPRTPRSPSRRPGRPSKPSAGGAAGLGRAFRRGRGRGPPGGRHRNPLRPPVRYAGRRPRSSASGRPSWRSTRA